MGEHKFKKRKDDEEPEPEDKPERKRKRRDSEETPNESEEDKPKPDRTRETYQSPDPEDINNPTIRKVDVRERSPSSRDKPDKEPFPSVPRFPQDGKNGPDLGKGPTK